MMRILCSLMLALMASSCSAGDRSPYLIFKAKFDAEKIDDVVAVTVDIANSWDLELFQKDRDQMKVLTKNTEAFFIALYFAGDPILVMTNVGVGEVITLSVTDHKKMPVKDLDRLAAQMVTTLKDEFDIEFKKEAN